MTNNKQETLEEAANRILSKEGVKYHLSGLETYLKGNVINAMVEMAKWQAGNGDITVNNIPDNTDENITTDKNTSHPMWTSTTTWDNLDTNHSLNLDTLRDKLDNMLSKETADSLNEWLNNKRNMNEEVMARVELMGVLDDVQSIMHELTLDELDVLIDDIKCVYERFSDITDARKSVKPE
jgi:hypothetical protein